MAKDYIRSEADDPEATTDLGEWFKLASDSGVSMLRLVKAELMLTLAELPLLGVLWMLMVPLLIFTWMGLSVLISWFVYEYTNEALAGFLSFFILQGLCTIAVMLKILSIQKGLMMFPASTRQIRKLAASRNNE
ncbi:MAG: hypothetical protein WDZ76_10240 [Pseudohongiellaceae bacterium]